MPPADPPIWIVTLVDILANSPVVVAPALLLSLWTWGRPGGWSGFLVSALAVFVGQGANLLAGLFFSDPRPFMVSAGHTLVAHAADNGFPSDDTTLVWTLGATLLLTRAEQRWGVIKRRSEPVALDRRALEVSLFVHLAATLQVTDVYVVGSENFAEYRAQLLPWAECDGRGPPRCVAELRDAGVERRAIPAGDRGNA
jgi:membrane-associated phospholipid phosphatase